MRWAFALLLVVWLPPESAPFSLTPSRTLRRARPARRAQLQPLIDEGALAREGPVRLPLPRADMPQISACDLPGAPSMQSSTVTLFLPTELIRIMRATAPTLPRSHTCVCLPRRRDDTRARRENLEAFYDALRARGVAIDTSATARAGDLRASQSELDEGKVRGLFV